MLNNAMWLAFDDGGGGGDEWMWEIEQEFLDVCWKHWPAPSPNNRNATIASRKAIATQPVFQT